MYGRKHVRISHNILFIENQLLIKERAQYVFRLFIKNIRIESNSGITSELYDMLDKFIEEKSIQKYTIEIIEVDDYVKHNIEIKLD